MKTLCIGLAPWCTAPALAAVLWMAPVRVEAQFTYGTNRDNTITITGYTGTNTMVEIPSTITGLPVTSIGPAAFMWCTDLIGVTIGNNVTSIGVYAFSECWNLASLIIPESVTEIGPAAFQNCHSLTNITLGSITTVSLQTFAGCTRLPNISFPGSVSSIQSEAFVACSSLTSITIPDSVTTIGYDAFNHCSSVTSVSLGRGLTNIDWGAFGACTSLPSITIPSALTSIASSTFSACTCLTNVIVGENVAAIGYNAFAGCTSLRTLFFRGNAPATEYPIFDSAATPTALYLPETTGWGPNFCGCPTMLWNPQIQTSYPTFGVQNNRFGFTITGTANIPLTIAATSDLNTGPYVPVQTCVLTNGSIYFRDGTLTDRPARFYRIRFP